MAFQVGSRLGHYDVTALIGEGGMGQVYQATDTQLGRDVALKILPDAFASDPDRLARFQREAQVLASLNHPGIAAIYGIEKSDDTQALVLELVEGPTLADRIAQGPIPIDEALPIAKQIVEALEAAHEAGVIHRDLKPANIKVREDGTVKVLDFGLAKALDTTPGGDPSQSPTLTAAATQMGVIMGTAAYMSPEQARGKPVDRRADVWAFGCVLFEMLTGRRAFEGDDVTQTLARVVEREPDWDLLPEALPGSLHSFVRQSFVKEARRRVRDIGDLRLALDGAFDLQTTPAAVAANEGRGLGSWQRAVALVTGAAIASGIIVGVAVWNLTRPAPTRVTRLPVSLPTDQPLYVSANNSDVAISPDGSLIVAKAGGGFTGRLSAWSLDRLEVTPLMEGASGWGHFISPNGTLVGFENAIAGTLESVSVLGGPATTICSLQGRLRGASWGEDGTIVFATDAGGLWRVAATGGEPEVLTSPVQEQGSVRHGWPHILPGGEAILFAILEGLGSQTARIAVLDVDSGEQVELVSSGSFPRYLPSGHIVYGVGGALRAVGFDPERLTVTTAPVTVLDGVFTKDSGAATFDVSAEGTLVYVPVTTGSRSASSDMTVVWVDREGRREPLPGLEPGSYRGISLSPDGAQLVLEVVERATGTADLWVYDVERATRDKVTVDPNEEINPLWTPNGDRIAFGSNRGGRWGLFWTDAAGRAAESLLTDESASDLGPYGWFADSTRLVFAGFYPGRRDSDIGVLQVEGDRTAEAAFEIRLSGQSPAVSPNDRWLAYQSNRSGQSEIYVASLPDLGDRVPVSRNGGRQPVWSRDGSELFYHSMDGNRLLAVPVETTADFQAGEPEPLFDVQISTPPGRRSYDVAQDGRFVMVVRGTGATAERTEAELVVVQNWFEELERLVPTN